MKVKELQELLKRFDPEADVHLCLSLPGRVISTHENVWLGDYGGGPQLTAALDYAQFHIYVGCGIEQLMAPVPEHEYRRAAAAPGRRELELGKYQSAEEAERVRDFYIFHKGLSEPLQHPDFDYEHWIPPRTTSGEYNPQIAEILREKLLKE